MANWTILGLTTADARPLHFAVTLDTGTSTWRAGGSDVAAVFNTRNGGSVIKPVPDLGTYLLDGAGGVVALLQGLTKASAVKDSGSGNVYETGKTISWSLESL